MTNCGELVECVRVGGFGFTLEIRRKTEIESVPTFPRIRYRFRHGLYVRLDSLFPSPTELKTNPNAPTAQPQRGRRPRASRRLGNGYPVRYHPLPSYNRDEEAEICGLGM